MKQSHPGKAIYFEPLEPRLLLSGSWGAGADAQASETNTKINDSFSQATVITTTVVEASPSGVTDGAVDLLSEAPALDLADSAATDTEAAPTSGQPAAPSASSMPADAADLGDATSSVNSCYEEAEPPSIRELVIVNDNVADYEQLVADMQGGNGIIDVVVLDADRDGIQQVSEILAQYSDLSAVHFIAHGADGQINIGGTWLNNSSLQQHADAVSEWGNALDENGDILFYGCSIASGSPGQSLLNDIAGLTGADVAASDDLTGSTELGGNWALEFTSGTVETQVAVGIDAQAGWEHLAAVQTAWLEDFADLADGTTSDAGATAWSTDASGIQGTGYAEVRGQRIEIKGTSIDGIAGQAVWRSEVIDISSYPDVVLSVDLDSAGSLDTGQDYIRVYYKLDGGAETLFTDGDKDGTFAATTVATPSLTGSTVQIVIRTNSTGPDELYYVDNVTVVAINNLPTANDDTLNTDEDTPLTITTATDLLANDTVPEGDTPILVDFSDPAHGSLVDNGDGTLTYTPDPGYNGADSFDYEVVDASTGLAHSWGLDGSATDDVGGADGTVNGTTTVAGSFGNGLSFNGTSDYVQMSDADITYNNEFTVSFDFKIDDNTGKAYQCLYSHGAFGTASSLNILIGEDGQHNGDRNLLIVRFADANDATNVMDLDWDLAAEGIVNATDGNGDGLWHNYTLVIKQGVGITAYLDGVKGKTVAKGGDAFDPTTDLFLGRREDNNPNRYFGGSLDSVKIFNTALSDDEVSGLSSGINQATANITVNPTDTSAVISGDISYTGNEGDTAAGDMDATDVDGLTNGSYFSVTTPAANGTAVIDAATGAWTFTPTNADWFGSDSFTVTVTDDQGGTSTQVVNITLANVDDAAIITGDISYSGNEGDVVAGNMDAADVDGLTDGSYFSVTTPASNGTTVIDAVTGAWTFTPTNANWFGSDSFAVTVTDDEGGTTAQVVNITLANVDDAAVISGDISYSGDEGDAITGDMDATDVDGLTDGTYFTISAQAGNGTAVIDAATGAWTFTPTNADWFGSDSFTVTVADDQGGTTTQVVNITLANVDDAAVISGDISYAGDEGDAVTGDMDATDLDGLTDGSYFTVTTPASNGTAVIDAATGAWTFTPTDADWFGSDSFTVTVTDDEGGTTTQVVSITLANVDDAAVISGDISYAGDEGDAITGDMDATDVDGLSDGAYFTVTTPASNGTAVIDAATGAWTFTPTNADWFGSDSFTVTVTDDQGGTTTQVVHITLANVDDAAVISGDISYAGDEGDAVTGDMDATDVDGLTDGTYFTVATPAANGTAVIDAATGAWTFTPTNADWFGSDSFTVTVTDDEGGTTTQVVSITLSNVDDAAIIAGDISYTGDEGDVVTGNMDATDVDGLSDGSYFTVSTPASNGTAVIDAATGAWTFTPTNADWFGSDSFSVTVTDDQGGTTTQIVNITLTNVDDAAVISGDISYAGNEGDIATGDLDATDVDGLTDGSYFTVTTPAANGTAVIDAATGQWTFTPTNADWFGSDNFTVTVTDDQGGTTTQIVNITLSNVDEAAVISGDISYAGDEGDAITGDMDATDVDGLTDGTYFTVTTPASNGTAVIDAATGAWTFTPTNADWFGSDSFTVTVTDDQGGTTNQIVSITLANVDDAAVISGDISYSGNEGEVVAGDMDVADVDGLTDGTYFTVTTPADNGTAVIDAATGAWTFTPANADWFGSDSFTVTVTDDEGGTTTQVVSITLANMDDAAIITGNISYTGNEGDVVTGDMDAADIDGLTYGSYFTVTTPAANGTAAIDAATGAWTFTATNADWFGSDSFTVTVTDDQGGTTTQVVNITLANVDDAAVISGDISYSGNEGDLAAGDMDVTDVDGLTDGSYFSVTTPAANGTAVIDAATGAWTFTPTNADWFGSDSFTVTVTDDQGGTTTQVVNITLANVDDAAIISGDISYNGNKGDIVAGDMDAIDIEGLTDNSYFSVSSQGANGFATIDPATGRWSYFPMDPDWVGTDSFTVTVTDDLGGTTTQVVDITLAN